MQSFSSGSEISVVILHKLQYDILLLFTVSHDKSIYANVLYMADIG